MCQFPFDLDTPSEMEPEMLSTYHVVLLNSAFSEYWYLQYTQRIIRQARRMNLPFPSLHVSALRAAPFDAELP
jgi:hypothetical protein